MGPGSKGVTDGRTVDMKCENRTCQKPLQGGFKQKSGGFLCAACLFHKHTISGLRDVIIDVSHRLEWATEIGHRPNKTELRKTQTKLDTALRVYGVPIECRHKEVTDG